MSRVEISGLLAFFYRRSDSSNIGIALLTSCKSYFEKQNTKTNMAIAFRSMNQTQRVCSYSSDAVRAMGILIALRLLSGGWTDQLSIIPSVHLHANLVAIPNWRLLDVQI